MRQITIDKLTRAYEFIILEKKTTGKIENPLVISQLQSNDGTTAYLIAKHPEQDMYFGMIESSLIESEKLIAAIPSENIAILDVQEVSFKPFRLKKYIEQNQKEYQKDDIVNHYLFMNSKFEKDVIFIRHLKNEEYFFDNESRLISGLKFNNEIQSLVIAIMSTMNVSEILGKEGDNYIFRFMKNSFTGLPERINVLVLFETLIVNCYGIKSESDFFSKAYASKDPILIHFAENIRINFISRINEVISLMNRPELNPNISYNDIIYGRTKTSLLIFNSFAYSNIFNDYITESRIKKNRD